MKEKNMRRKEKFETGREEELGSSFKGKQRRWKRMKEGGCGPEIG